MKQLFKMGVMALVVTALVLSFGACGTDEIADENISDIDWKDYKDFSIKVSNNTKKDLVAFHSSLSMANILGGINAGTSDHGLKNDPGKFGSSPKQFKMIFITREQYNENKNNLSQLNNDYFTQMFVFWNGAAGDNEKVYAISDKLGGEYQLEILNDSNYNVELRVDGPNGPLLGFAPNGIVKTRLYVGQGEFEVYPVFKYLNTQREIIETIYPKRADGKPFRRALTFNEQESRIQQINLHDALANISARSSGVCYLKIYNMVATGSIGLKKGTSVQTNAMGFSTWGSQNAKEFVVDMPSVAGSDTFASEVTIDNFFITQTSDEVKIVDVEKKESRMTLKADMLYTVYVTGEPGTADTFTALVELRAGQEHGPTGINFTNLFN
jgi:hypothetical protein